MPPLTQLYAATGRQTPRDDEAVIQASIPSLYAFRERQIQAENLALARREQELAEEQAAENARQVGRATTIQSLALIPSTLTSIEAIKPGALAGLGKMVGIGGGSSGAAAASGLTTSASGVAGGVGTAAAFPAFGGASAAGTAAAEGAIAGNTIPATTGVGAAATGTLASVGAYAAPAAAGFVAGKVGGAIAPSLLPFGGKTGERVERDIGGVAAGAGAGALIGTSVFPGIGTGVGAIIGGAAGLLGAESVIATATCGRDSPEVALAQQYRRRYVGRLTYAGYRRFGDPMARWLTRHPCWKPVIKRMLVRPACRYFTARLADATPPLWLRLYIGGLERLSRELGRRAYRRIPRWRSALRAGILS